MFIVVYGEAEEFTRLAREAGHRVFGQNPRYVEMDETVDQADLVVCVGDLETVERVWEGSSVRLERLEPGDEAAGRSLAESLPTAQQDAPTPTDGLVAPEHRNEVDLFSMDEDELRDYADQKGIDLGRVQKVESIIARIKQAEEAEE